MNGILDTFADPHMRHAAMVHLPIVAAMLAPLLLLIFAATKFKSRTVALLTLGVLLMASAGAGLAANAGEGAEESLHLHRVALTAPAKDALHKHEELAEGGWIWPLIPAACLAVALFPKKTLWRAVPTTLAFLSSVGVTGWIALTAHAGGDLVYRYGVGAPSPALQTSPAPTDARQPASDDDD